MAPEPRRRELIDDLDALLAALPPEIVDAVHRLENAENLIILKHHPELIEAYRRNFEVHQAHCQAPGTVKMTTPGQEHLRRAA